MPRDVVPDVSVLGWILLGAGALVIGLSKAALPGSSTLAIAAFAAVLPAKQSTGTILLLLIVGDLFALWVHRRHARLRALIRLAPAVIVGLLAGVVFLAFASNEGVRIVIGVILLVIVVVTLWRRRGNQPPAGRTAAVVYGSLGGFTTMVANAAGPIMSLYFLAAKFPVRAFLGTTAWFFAIVNIVKVPFAAGLGLITPGGLLIVAVLVPLVIVGGFIGRSIAERISQQVFDKLVIALTVVGAIYLLLPIPTV